MKIAIFPTPSSIFKSLVLCKILSLWQVRSQSHFFCGERFFWRGSKKQIGGSCLCYYAHRKMTSVKMVLVRFLKSHNLIKLGCKRVNQTPTRKNWFIWLFLNDITKLLLGGLGASPPQRCGRGDDRPMESVPMFWKRKNKFGRQVTGAPRLPTGVYVPAVLIEGWSEIHAQSISGYSTCAISRRLVVDLLYSKSTTNLQLIYS